MPEYLQNMSIKEIMDLKDIKERIKVYYEETNNYREFIKKHSKTKGDAIIIDIRRIEDKPIGNRFIEYTLYPESNISIRLMDGKSNKFVMISVGKSIINKTSHVDVGSLMLRFKGGGHKAVGTCQVKHFEADDVVLELLKEINI